MALPVSQIAYVHAVEIDENKAIDARKMERLGLIASERGKDALKESISGYDELQRYILEEIITSMQVTHRTIVAIISACEGKAEIVDTLTLARTQLEGLYNFSLMLESSDYIDRYLKDGWKKRYIDLLLQKEETKGLSRFDDFNNVLMPRFLEEGRKHYRITEIESASIRDTSELGGNGGAAPMLAAPWRRPHENQHF